MPGFPLAQLALAAGNARNAYSTAKRDAEKEARDQGLKQALAMLQMQRQDQQDKLAAALQSLQSKNIQSQIDARNAPKPVTVIGFEKDPHTGIGYNRFSDGSVREAPYPDIPDDTSEASPPTASIPGKPARTLTEVLGQGGPSAPSAPSAPSGQPRRQRPNFAQPEAPDRTPHNFAVDGNPMAGFTDKRGNYYGPDGQRVTGKITPYVPPVPATNVYLPNYNPVTKETTYAVVPNRGAVTSSNTGIIKPPSVAGEDKKLRERHEALANVTDAITNFENQLKAIGTTVTWGKNKGRLQTAYRNMQLQLKGPALYNLGVLSGPDLDIITSIINDPTDLFDRVTAGGSAKEQTSRVLAQVQDLRTLLDGYAKNAGMSTTAPVPVPPGGGRGGGAGSSGNIDLDAEARKAKAGAWKAANPKRADETDKEYFARFNAAQGRP